MRKSILDNDVSDWEAYCDGQRVPFCYAADDEEGWAESYEIEDDQLVVQEDPKSGKKHLVIIRIYGRIEFRERFN